MAHAWPLTGMNNFGFPGFTHRIERINREALVTRYEDGTESRREKSSTTLRRWTERWAVNRTDMKAMLVFYETKGLVTTFTKLALDASDATFPTTEATARFEQQPVYDQVGPNWYHVTFTFIEVA